MSESIAVLYEHPEWFAPLFAELDRRGLPYERLSAHEYAFDPDAVSLPYSLIVNRVSPSAYLRGHTSAMFFARQYLAHAEALGVPVVNGTRAYDLELSKAKQLSLLSSLGIQHPRSTVVSSVGQIEAAAAQLEYPVIVKPNIGGSGALMTRFDTPAELAQGVQSGALDSVLGLDYTAVVQEYHVPKGGSIVRVEMLDGELLYAIRIHNDPSQGFNLCPADICQVDLPQAPAQEFEYCPVDAPAKRSLRIEAEKPPEQVVGWVRQIFEAGGIDVGGVEYLESERDGNLYVYDVNALSNFVTDAPTLVGFDPFARFVDYIEQRAGVGPRVSRAATAV